MKKIIFLAALFVSSSAFAESIYCTFTEPFYTVTYSSDDNEITYEAVGEDPVVLPANVTFGKNGKLIIKDNDETHTLEVLMTEEGDDGMSDFTYPFKGIFDYSLFGGCETSTMKKWESRGLLRR
ncbi:hypothetical protein [Bdellovibrio sp. HCB2-146]|uniref:hypothetical protein n=1 Tax=Bdellovibrio sp. HCB2-146 TaxID=3394362 RepID=UPI0039BD0F0E